MPNLKDISGQRFGRLTALRISHVDALQAHWVCRCDCGAETTARFHHLIRDHKRSCGCLKRDRFTTKTHGHAPKGKPSSAYSTWCSMKRRCFNPKDKAWKHYGGRGITVCDRWRDSFESFLADMGEPPPGLSLDRRENNGNYEPGNCRWATQSEQVNNSRRWANKGIAEAEPSQDHVKPQSPRPRLL